MSATVIGGALFVRKTSSFRTFRSISTSGSTSLEDGILGLTLNTNGKKELGTDMGSNVRNRTNFYDWNTIEQNNS